MSHCFLHLFCSRIIICTDLCTTIHHHGDNCNGDTYHMVIRFTMKRLMSVYSYIEFVINGISIIFCFFTVDSAQNMELRGSIVANYEYADSGPQVYSKLNHHLGGVEVMKDEILGQIASHRNPICNGQLNTI